ncbi:MAG: YgfZ/GcvT domain-containing protein, partial [Polymorphobacter sp.]
LAPAAPLWAALLSAQGKPLADMLLFDGGEAVWIEVAAASAAGLARKLAMYKLRRDVMVTMTDLKVFAAWGAPHDAAADPRLAALGSRWIAGAAATGATLVDYDAHRLALGVPDSADLLLDKMMWLEANAAELNGVSFTKGCYVGQENVARMHHRDRLRKRLLPVTFDGDPGDGIIRAGDREAGALRSHRGGCGIAYLRLEFVEANAPLAMNGHAVDVRWPAYLAPPN